MWHNMTSDTRCVFIPLARDKNGKTVLFHCLHNTMRHARCLDFLVECGADPNQIVSPE